MQSCFLVSFCFFFFSSIAELSPIFCLSFFSSLEQPFVSSEIDHCFVLKYISHYESSIHGASMGPYIWLVCLHHPRNLSTLLNDFGEWNSAINNACQSLYLSCNFLLFETPKLLASSLLFTYWLEILTFYPFVLFLSICISG